MSDVRIPITVTGDAVRKVNDTRSAFERLRAQASSSIFTGLGLGAGVTAFDAAKRAVGAFTDFLGDSIAAAREEEAGIARLGAALSANVPNWEAHSREIDAAVTAGEELAFADDAVRDSLARLAPRTRDVTEAVELQRLAMDLARFRGIDLAAATDLVGKAYDGNVGALRRAGVAIDENATATEALAALQSVTAGQAEAFGDSSEGAALRMGIAWENLQEDLGEVLLPIMTDLANFVTDDLIPAVRDFGEGVGDVLRPVGELVDEIDGPLLEALGAAGDVLDEYGNVLIPVVMLPALARLAGGFTGATAASNALNLSLTKNPFAIGIVGALAFREATNAAGESLSELAGEGENPFSSLFFGSALTGGYEEWTGALNDLRETGVSSWDAIAAATGRYEGGLPTLVGLTSAAAEEMEEALAPVADEWRWQVAELLGTAEEIPEGLRVILEGGTEVIGEDAAALANKLPIALEAAKTEAERIMRDTLSGMVEILTADEFTRAQEAHQASLANQWSDTARIMTLYAELASAGIGEGLRSGDTAQVQATTEYVNSLLEQLGVLIPAGTTIGENVPLHLRDGFIANMGLAEEVLIGAAGRMGYELDFREAAREQGLAGILKFAEGEAAGEEAAATAARNAAYAAWRAMETDGSTAGANLVDTYVAGMRSRTPAAETAAHDVGRRISRMLGIASEPEDPRSPLRGITKWGGNLVDTFAEGIERELPRLDSALAGISTDGFPSSFASAGSAAGGGYAGSTGGSPITVNVNISTMTPLTPGQVADLVNTIGPAIDEHLRRRHIWRPV